MISRSLFCTLVVIAVGYGCGSDDGEDTVSSSNMTSGATSDAGTTTDTTEGTGILKWYYTCGDPVCSGHSDLGGGNACTTEAAGDSCSSSGNTCDPVDDCNRQLLCTDSDPSNGPGGCPVSRRTAKRDIVYLTTESRREVRDKLLAMPLATWQYRDAITPRRHLGFIIEDIQPAMSIDPDRSAVDLYSYTSMTVAAVQEQALEIEGLKRELKALRELLESQSKTAEKASP